MKKRILPIVLVLVMLLSLLPAQVFAASYTFDPNATIFTQNYTTETPRPNNLGDYFTVTTTPLSTANKTAAWTTGNNGTSVAVFNKNGSKLYEDTHAILTFTFKKNCNFWFKHLFSISSGSPYSYAELRLNGTAIAKGTSSDKLASPYNVDVKAGDIFEIDFYSEEDFMTPCAMTLKNIRCTDPVSSDVTVTFDANGGEGTMDAQTLTGGNGSNALLPGSLVHTEHADVWFSKVGAHRRRIVALCGEVCLQPLQDSRVSLCERLQLHITRLQNMLVGWLSHV